MKFNNLTLLHVFFVLFVFIRCSSTANNSSCDKNRSEVKINCNIYFDSIEKFCFDEVYKTFKNNKKINLLFFTGYGSFSDHTLNCNILNIIKSDTIKALQEIDILSAYTFLIDDKNSKCNEGTMAKINSKGLFQITNTNSTPQLVILVGDSLIKRYSHEANIEMLLIDIESIKNNNQNY